MQSFILQQSLVASCYGELQIVLTYMMLFLVFYAKINKFLEEQGLNLPENYPNRQFIKRFIGIYQEMTGEIVLTKEDKVIVQLTFNNTLFNANGLNVEIAGKNKQKTINKQVRFGEVETVLYQKP